MYMHFKIINFVSFSSDNHVVELGSSKDINTKSNLSRNSLLRNFSKRISSEDKDIEPVSVKITNQNQHGYNETLKGN